MISKIYFSQLWPVAMMGPKPLWSRMWAYLLKDFNEKCRKLKIIEHIKNKKILTIGGNHSHESHTNENTK